MHEEFARKVWPTKKRRRSEIYNRWKFRGPEKGDVNGFILAVAGKKVVGQLGVIPVKLICRGKEYNAQWACDLMVDPDLRKSGIGNKLFAEAMNREMITLGNNPSPKADVLMTKAGFKPFDSGRLMVFPVDPSLLVSWAVPQKLSAINPLVKKVITPYFNFKKKNILKKHSEFKTCTLEDIEKLIRQRQSKDENPQIKHDMEFLQWRATGFLEYVPKLKTICSAKGSYAIYSHFGLNFNIYEWYCEESEFESMYSYLFSESEKEITDIIQVVANSESEKNLLSKIGFLKFRKNKKVIYYNNINFDTKEDMLENSGKFYFTLYDTDVNL